MASGIISNHITSSPMRFAGTINTTFCQSGNVYGYIIGKMIWVSGWIQLKSNANPAKDDVIVSNIPEPINNVNLLYFDQNANYTGALYIPINNTVITRDLYSVSSILGHYINFTTVYMAK